VEGQATLKRTGESGRSLEELYGSLVLFCGLARAERSQISAFAGHWIRFPGIHAVATGLELSDHTQGVEQLLRHKRLF
jgi:hypothetical protein